MVLVRRACLRLRHRYAQLEQRYELSRCTHQISVFTEGILGMKQVLLGVIQIDPRKILEDGIRKQLVMRISQSMHTFLQFAPADRRAGLQPKQVEDALNALAAQLDGVKTSFECVRACVRVCVCVCVHACERARLS